MSQANSPGIDESSKSGRAAQYVRMSTAESSQRKCSSVGAMGRPWAFGPRPVTGLRRQLIDENGTPKRRLE
jgi:hypothetical protein